MDLGLLEQKLRALPGVLDCSVSAEGVAVVVHPEVDPRLIEMQAQVLLAEAGDRRPLLVVGGMTTGPRVLPPARSAPGPRARRTGPSPLSLAGFAVLVLALLAVVPIAGRDGGSDRTATSAQRQAAGRQAPSGLGRVPLDEEEVVVVAGPPPASEAAPAEPESTGTVDLGGVVLASSSPSRPSEAASSPVGAPPAAAVVAAAPAPEPVGPATAGKGKKGKADKAGKGTSRAERPGSGGGDALMAAVGPSGKGGPPGKADPPGRRRGHHR